MYEKNVFKSYRTVTKIHLGQLNDSLSKDEVILFDGFTLRRGGKDHDLPSLQGAVKMGWLVPESSSETSDTYRPKAASVQIGEAISKTDKRTMRSSTTTVQHDEQDVGELSAIRGDKALPIHDSKNSGNLKKVAEVRDDDGAVVVGRFKTSAKAEPIEIGKDDRRVVQTLDNQSSVKVIKASGDVQTAMVGDNLEDILPEATSSSKPAPGIAGEGRGDESEMRARAVVASGSSAVGTGDDGEIVGTVQHAEPETPATPSEIQKAKLSVAQALIPGFEWDFSASWLLRAKIAVDKYRDNPEYMNAIMAIELPSVQRQITKWLKK